MSFKIFTFADQYLYYKYFIRNMIKYYYEVSTNNIDKLKKQKLNYSLFTKNIFRILETNLFYLKRVKI